MSDLQKLDSGGLDSKKLGDIVRGGVKNYFKSAKTGKKMPDTRVKKIFKRRLVRKGGKK